MIYFGIRIDQTRVRQPLYHGKVPSVAVIPNLEQSFSPKEPRPKSTVTPSKWDAHAFAVDQKEVGDGGPSSNHDDDDDSESSSSFSSEQQEYTIFNDKQLMTAIAERGSVNPESVAITKAFEAWVEETARNYWGDTQISKLSVDFLVAFGNELTE
eukprot:CAMPEP_0194210338 /NCGR_PEP_ID=MMETSP0156-20130528/8163_1 /TAXON_ID=33649 /ORGANISM="Thalassionema nitzschioides, Strain L26-B" /LENGTH=154 /DNA_ID=CAMNT_0038937667 /DNA_START=289 /DNA_END=754 /DNA_ORIENTATION=-